jgi:peptide/nickel transport system permease protein
LKKNKNYLISEKFTKRHIFLTDFLSALANTKTGLFGAFVVLLMFFLAIFAPWIAPYDPTLIDVPNRLQPPNLSHWMGTDLAGRDVLSRLMWGARPSLQVGVLAVLIGMPGGIVIGLIAGFYRGSILETILMRATEIIAAVPLLIVAVAIVGILGVNPIDLGFFTITNEIKIVFVLGILYIPGLARVVFAVASTESVSDYIRARKTQGVRDFSLIFGDVLPNCLSVVTVWATLLTAGGVLAEAGLSFVGLVAYFSPAGAWVIGAARSCHRCCLAGSIAWRAMSEFATCRRVCILRRGCNVASERYKAGHRLYRLWRL